MVPTKNKPILDKTNIIRICHYLYSVKCAILDSFHYIEGAGILLHLLPTGLSRW
jgi:hypothetical protein